jgi:hypothetical protein
MNELKIMGKPKAAVASPFRRMESKGGLNC